MRWKIPSHIAFAAALFATTLPSSATPDIEVSLSPRLEKTQDIVAVQDHRAFLFSLNNLAFNLAGDRDQIERNVWTVEDFRLDRQLRYRVQLSLAAANVNPEHKLRFHIEEMHLSRAPVGAYRGAITRIEGHAALVDEAGEIVKEVRIAMPYVTERITRLQGYDGPHAVFLPIEENRRPGALLALFSERALDELFPEHATEIPGPIIFMP